MIFVSLLIIFPLFFEEEKNEFRNGAMQIPGGIMYRVDKFPKTKNAAPVQHVKISAMARGFVSIQITLVASRNLR